MRPFTAGGHSTRRDRSRLSDRIGGRLASTAHAQPSPAPPAHGRRPNHLVCSCHHAPREGRTNSVVRVMLIMYVRCTSDLALEPQPRLKTVCRSTTHPPAQIAEYFLSGRRCTCFRDEYRSSNSARRHVVLSGAAWCRPKAFPGCGCIRWYRRGRRGCGGKTFSGSRPLPMASAATGVTAAGLAA
jgi:hypothetical protein